MKVLFNIIWWFPYLGFLLALSYAISGLLWCVTIIGIPVGLGMFQIATFLLAPHTHMLVSKNELNEASGDEMNSLWKYFALVVRILYFPFGLVNAIVWAVCVVANFFTLIGIPNAIALSKAFSAVFNPVHKVCVSYAVGEELQRINAQNQISKCINRNRIESDTKLP